MHSSRLFFDDFAHWDYIFVSFDLSKCINKMKMYLHYHRLQNSFGNGLPLATSHDIGHVCIRERDLRDGVISLSQSLTQSIEFIFLKYV